MITDDFETRLRTRLADLADAEDGWADPLPEARRRAVAVDLDDATVVPRSRTPRRWWPGLAVAATLAALLVGGGFGVRELVRTSGQNSGSASGASMDYAASCATATPCDDNGVASAPSAERGGSEGATSGAGAGVGGSDTAGCAVTRPPASTGPLADIASIRPSGIASPRTTSGGSADISYQLTFGATGGTIQTHAAQALWTYDDTLCGAPPGTAQSNAIQVVPVEPGAGVSGAATFEAVDSGGNPLPHGTYEVHVVIEYDDPGSDGPSYLVSPQVSVVVS